MSTAIFFLFLLVISSSISQALSSACKKEILCTIEDGSDGVTISIFPAGSMKERTSVSPGSSQASQQLLLRGHHLSQECSHDFSRCQNLLVETFFTNESQHSFIFIPLHRELALVEVKRDANLLYHMDSIFLRTYGESPAFDCSPSTSFKILTAYHVVCTNKTTNFVSVFEVLLNKTSLQSSRIAYLTNHITIPSSVGNISNSSNFIHVEIDENHEYIAFAVGTAIYTFRPFLYIERRLGDIPSMYCDRVHTVVPLHGAQFRAFCSESYIRYDIGEGDWLDGDTFTRKGVPYSCPRSGTNLSVFSSYIQYNIRNNLHENVEILEGEHNSGICFGNSTQRYFAFVGNNGTFVLDLETSNLTAILPSSTCQGCLPLIVKEDRYLIYRDDTSRRVTVLDLFGEQLVLIEALHVTAPLVTLLSMECPQSPPDVLPPDIINQVPRDDIADTRNDLGKILPGAVVPIVVLLAILLAVVLIAVQWKKSRLSKPVQEEVQEDGQTKCVSIQGSNVLPTGGGSITQTAEQESRAGRCKTFQRAGNKDLIEMVPLSRTTEENANKPEPTSSNSVVGDNFPLIISSN